MASEFHSPVRRLISEFEQAYIAYIKKSVCDGMLVPAMTLLEKGKRLRSRLFFICQGLFGEPISASMPVAMVIELIHAASLIHDDIIDRSDCRRGQPTLNHLFGSHVSLLTGDYLLALAIRLGSEFQKIEVIGALSQTLIEMTQSELIKAIHPVREQLKFAHYAQCAAGKTGSLIASACVLGGRMQHVSTETESQLHRFGHAFGMAFQIQDDILDLSGSPLQMGKPVGQDEEGKHCTLPLILAFEHASSEMQRRFLDTLYSHEDVSFQKEFIRMYDGLNLATQKRNHFAEKARRILAQWPDSLFREELERLIELNTVRQN